MNKAKAQSILSRLMNVATANHVVYNEILLRYAIERIIYRIGRSSLAGRFILKGGNLFVLWTGGFNCRPTMDADFELRGEIDEGKAFKYFRDLAAMDTEELDGVVVDGKTVSVEPIRDDDEYGGLRISMRIGIGTAKVPVQLDIGIGDAITPVAKLADFPTLLEMDAPRIRVYPKETVIAEKYQTIVHRGMANSRMKDYYDLYVLGHDEGVDAAILQKAIANTFKRRGTELPKGIPSGLSDEFAENDSKKRQWRSFLAKHRLSDEFDLKQVVEYLRQFLLWASAGSDPMDAR